MILRIFHPRSPLSRCHWCLLDYFCGYDEKVMHHEPHIKPKETMAAGKLIVDFPTATTTDHRHNRSVHFADMAEMCIVPRLVDYEDARGRDLWYSNSEYSRMNLARRNSALQAREMISAGIPVSYSGTGRARDDGSPDEDDSLIGIEHLLTPATILEFMACRRRCVGVVLEEQARQRQRMNPPDMIGWDSISIASIAETRRAVVRARKLGKLQRDAADAIIF